VADDLDYSNEYNTPLPPRDEERFQEWVKAQSEKTGRRVDNDLYDYDLRGYWQKNKDADLSDAHLTDRYKKPNHPTFSSESRFHGEDGLEGGEWAKNPDGSWRFTPGATNLEMHGPNRLRRYFDRVEPGNTIILPNGTIVDQ